MEKIGFIGLGHMGQPMVENLLQQNFSVMVYDLNADAVAHCVKLGAIAAEKINDIAQHANIIFTMLQNGQQVFEVLIDLFNTAKPGTLFIDCSSIDVDTTRQLHQIADEKKFALLDAPVSGGVTGAKAASLTFMVGGKIENFSRAENILKFLGKKIIHAGAAGNGQVAKICNNMILGISMIAVSEAFVLAEKLGLSAEKLFEISSNSSGQCWAMTSYCPAPGLVATAPSNNHYQAGFTAAMMLKDLKLSQSAATSIDAKTKLGSLATETYQQYVDEGFSQIDFSGIINFLR
jgi:3-hydroxyisobutyrate dehydrogenase